MAGLVQVLVITVPLLSSCGGPSGVGGSRAIVDNDGRFGNGPKSADAFAAMATQLLRAGRRCQAAAPKDDRPCLALFEAAAAAETAGGALVGCTAPGVYATRIRWRDYLDRLARYEQHPVAERPRLPAVEAC